MRRRSKIILGITLVTVSFVKAQERTKWIAWGGPFTEEYKNDAIIQIGISTHFASQQYGFRKSEHWDALIGPEGVKSFGAISAPIGYSLGMGIPFDIHVNPKLDLIINPTVNYPLTPVTIKYAYSDGSNPSTKSGRVDREGKKSSFSTLEVPVSLKINLSPRALYSADADGHLAKNKTAFFLYGGMKYTYNWSASKYYQEEYDISPHFIGQEIVLTPQYWNLEAGLGIDIYLTYIKVSPALRFSHSVGNLLDKAHPIATDIHRPNPYMNALQRLALRSVQFSIILE